MNPMPSRLPTLCLSTTLLLAACSDNAQPSLPLIKPVDMRTIDMRTLDQGAKDMAQDQPADMRAVDQGKDMLQDQGDLGDMALDMPQDQGSDMSVEQGQESLTITVAGDQIQLSWRVQPAASLRLLRRANNAVSDAQDPDAMVIAQGSINSFTHPTSDLEPDPERYHYALFACDAQGQSCTLAAPAQQLTLTLTQALQGGGYNIIWRHASASTCGDDTTLGTAATTAQPDWWRSCESTCNMATARQLTDPDATTEMMQVNTYMRGRQIPFSRVLSSEFCRCFQTADGFDLGPTTEQLPELTFFVYDEPQRCDNSLALLNTPPMGATNVAMVGHAGFTCQTLGTLAWGEAAIFKPVPTLAEPKLIQRVRADQWAQLP